MKTLLIKVFVFCFCAFVMFGCKFILRDASAHIGEIMAEPVSNLN